MSEYTPATKEVAEAVTEWAWSRRMFRPDLASTDGHEFDRWLAQYTAEKRAEWEAKQGETEWRDVVLSREKGDEGDWEATVWTPSEIGEARGQFPDFEYVLGKAMWMPVPDTTGDESEGKA